MTDDIHWSDYDVLCNAMSNVVWRRAAFREMISVELREHEDLINRLSFEGTKKETSRQLINILKANPEKYHDLTLKLMKDLSKETIFSDIKRLPKTIENDELLAKAQQSISDLKAAYEPYAKEEMKIAAIRKSEEERQIKEKNERRFNDSLLKLKTDFEDLTNYKGKPQERGLRFERWLKGLLDLYDLNPHSAYMASSDQIDGAFEFNSETYILEAKWLEKPVERKEADIFNAKLQRKNRNTQGLFVSIKGFTQGFKEQNQVGSMFITMDGIDIMGVLDRRMSLTELLYAKRNHVATTGDCYWPISKCIDEQWS